MATKLWGVLFFAICLIVSESAEKDAASKKKKKASKVEDAQAKPQTDYGASISKIEDTLKQLNVADIEGYGKAITAMTERLDSFEQQLSDPSVLESLRNSVDALSSKVQSLETSQQTQSSSSTSTADSLSQLTDSVSKLTTTVSTLDASQSSTSASTSTLSTKLDALISSVADLTSKLNTLQSAHDILSAAKQSAPDTSSLTSSITSQIETLSTTFTTSLDSLDARIARELTSTSKRLDVLEETADDISASAHAANLKQIQADFATLSSTFEANFKAYETSFTNIKERFASLEQSLSRTNGDVKSVYQATMAYQLDQLYALCGVYVIQARDYAYDLAVRVGEFTMAKGNEAMVRVSEVEWRRYGEEFLAMCMDGMEKGVQMGKEGVTRVSVWVQEYDWQGLYERVTDKKRWVLLGEWFGDVYAYCDFWWMKGIQPAMVKQVNEAYYGVMIWATESVQYVHGHVVYGEMMKQSRPYLQQVGVPGEYHEYVADGLLVVFVVTGMYTLLMVLGLMCDCCCPEMPARKVNDAGAQKDVKNGVVVGNGMRQAEPGQGRVHGQKRGKGGKSGKGK